MYVLPFLDFRGFEALEDEVLPFFDFRDFEALEEEVLPFFAFHYFTSWRGCGFGGRFFLCLCSFERYYGNYIRSECLHELFASLTWSMSISIETLESLVICQFCHDVTLCSTL